MPDVTSILHSVFSLVAVLCLIGLCAFLLKKFAVERLHKGIKKGDEKRLHIKETLLIDARNKLVLIERDDTEHLLLLGQEKALVVEQNIKPQAKTKKKS